MGLFDFLFKKLVKIHDACFGELLLVDFKDASKNYFEGKGFFSPTQSETDFLIEANSEGPTDEQKAFYTELINHFDAFVQKMQPLIEAEFRNWMEDFSINNFKEEFQLVCITIPRMDTKPLIWDMAFTTVHDRDHQITIDFVDGEPNGILIDG